VRISPFGVLASELFNSFSAISEHRDLAGAEAHAPAAGLITVVK